MTSVVFNAKIKGFIFLTHPMSADAPLTFDSAYTRLKGQWPIITACTAGVLLVAMCSLLLMSPRYETKVYLDAPYAAEISELNIGRTGDIKPYAPEALFAYFTKQLTSDEALQRFFTEVYLPTQEKPPESAAARQALYAAMVKNAIKITPPPVQPKAGVRNQYSIEASADTGEKTSRWLTALLEQIAKEARSTLVNDIARSTQLEIKNTERVLDERLKTTTKLRQDRQAHLSEALRVAQAVGIKDPQMTVAQPPRQDSAASFIDGSRLYARGVKSLQAELNVLQERKDDAPFVDGLRAAQAQINLLKEQHPDERQFSMFRIDGDIVTPEKPVAPKKSLILALGLVLGLMLGFFVALVRTGILRQMMQEEPEPRQA